MDLRSFPTMVIIIISLIFTTEGRNASKDELVMMYEFLKEKYIQLPRTSAVEEVWSPPKRQQQPQPQLSVTHHHSVKDEPVEATQVIQDPHSSESPFSQLYQRCEEKANRLLAMVDDNETIERVKQVFESILLPLYRESGDMSAGCEFLDAGHQLETLLDVGLAYGKNTLHVIKQGCSELLGEFTILNARRAQGHYSNHFSSDKFYPARDAGTQSVQVSILHILASEVILYTIRPFIIRILFRFPHLYFFHGCFPLFIDLHRPEPSAPALNARPSDR